MSKKNTNVVPKRVSLIDLVDLKKFFEEGIRKIETIEELAPNKRELTRVDVPLMIEKSKKSAEEINGCISYLVEVVQKLKIPQS